jgi:OmpA-OmpF porin, OOP family
VRLIKISVLAATMIMTPAVMAAMALPTGWYLEGNGGSSRISSVNYGSGLSNTSSGFGWNVNGGYKFMPYVAAEIGYTRYAQTKVRSAGTNVANDNHYSYYFAGKGILPLSDSGIDLFAKLGLGRLNSHVIITNPSIVNANNVNAGSRAVIGAYFGVGGDYSFTPNLALNAQWNRQKGSSTTGNLDLYSLGLTYTFG